MLILIPDHCLFIYLTNERKGSKNKTLKLYDPNQLFKALLVGQASVEDFLSLLVHIKSCVIFYLKCERLIQCKIFLLFLIKHSSVLPKMYWNIQTKKNNPTVKIITAFD